jgi:hypothetical protein
MTRPSDEERDALRALHERLSALERRDRRRGRALPLLLIAAGLLGALAGRFGLPEPRVWAQERAAAMEITCRALKVVDEQGKVRVLLGVDQFGGIASVKNAQDKTVATIEADNEGGFLSISANDGGERTFVGVGDKQGGGHIYLKDDKGKRRGALTVYKDGHGGLSFLNEQNKNEIFLGPSTKGWGGLLNLNAPDGKARIILDVDKDARGALELLNNDQKTEVFIGTSAKSWGGLFNINAPNGKAGVILDIDEQGFGRMNLRTKEEKRFLFAGGDLEGGTISVYGLDGKERMFLGVGDKASGGMINLFNPDNNKARLLMGVDNGGVGFTEGRDAEGTTRRVLR